MLTPCLGLWPVLRLFSQCCRMSGVPKHPCHILKSAQFGLLPWSVLEGLDKGSVRHCLPSRAGASRCLGSGTPLKHDQRVLLLSELADEQTQR